MKWHDMTSPMNNQSYTFLHPGFSEYSESFRAINYTETVQGYVVKFGLYQIKLSQLNDLGLVLFYIDHENASQWKIYIY